MKPKFRVPASKYKAFIVFVDFLKANKALIYFNLICRNVFESDEDFWILDAFVWTETIQEAICWSELDDMWQDKLKREQNQ